MRPFSFPLVLSRAAASAKRFPLVVGSALAASTAATILLQPGSHPEIERLLLAALLGLPLFTALTLAAERWSIPIQGRLAGAVLGLLLLAAFYRITVAGSDELAWTRFFHWSLGFHAAVAILPYAGRGSPAAFWQYNRLLITRFLLAAVYSTVLFLGLALALGAIDRLLGVDVDSRMYPRLFVLLTFLVNPWFFLSGIPDLGELERVDDYPAGLRVFARYVLMPLVTIYLVILTLYLGKVLVTRTWPSGWIGYLVSGVSATGTLALLLLHPIRSRPGERWVDRFARWFFIVLAPALVMALLAVGKRIGQYGVTERRYALLVLALWLLGLALFYAVTRSRSIRLIPASLAIVAAAAAIGPWSMIRVSRRSQERRFAGIMAANGSADGVTLPDPARLDSTSRRELAAVARYLDRVHGPEALAWLIDAPADSVRAWPPGTRDATALARIGITEVEPETRSVLMFDLTAAERDAGAGVALAGGEQLYPFRRLLSPFALRYRDRTFAFVPRLERGELAITAGLDTVAVIPLGSALAPALFPPGSIQDRPTTRREPLVIDTFGAGLRFRLVISEAYWSVQPADSFSRSASGVLVIGPQP